jgi:predicted GTPase
VGSIRETFENYRHLSELLPAMGYGQEQMEELRETIARSDADLVLIGTPIDLRRVIDLDKRALRVSYRLQELGQPTLAELMVERGIIDSVPALA